MARHGGSDDHERRRRKEAEARGSAEEQGGADPEEDGDREERERLAAARRYFRAAPPYRIQFEEDGRVSLCRKRYSYWGDDDPAAATRWEVLSCHADREEAERRLRHITEPVTYYDERGRLVAGPAARERDWGVPGEEEEEEED